MQRYISDRTYLYSYIVFNIIVQNITLPQLHYHEDPVRSPRTRPSQSEDAVEAKRHLVQQEAAAEFPHPKIVFQPVDNRSELKGAAGACSFDLPPQSRWLAPASRESL
jgi:hypothetical protein